MSYTQYSTCLAELMRGAGISTPTHGYKPEQAFADGRKLIDRIAELERDAARLDWIIDNCTIQGGGDGFGLHVFVPVDCEDVKTAIDSAIQGERANAV